MKAKQLILLATAALSTALVSCGEDSSKSSASSSDTSHASGFSSSTSNSSSATGFSSDSSATSEAVYFVVTFDLNFETGSTFRVEVEEGDLVARPDNPERDGFGFNGWYTEAACETLFDFATPITEDITLYADWVEIDPDTRIATFHWNLPDVDVDVYDVVYFKAGGRVTKPADPVLVGKNFRGWFNEAACTTEWKYLVKYEDNIDVYAKWFNVYTWEAEYTQLTDLPEDDPTANEFGEKIGHGYSSDVFGTGLIFPDGGASGLVASNGYFVFDLYYKDCYLEFDITSDRAVDNAILVARLSAEYYDMTFVPSKDNGSKEGPHGYDFIVNGTALDYDPIVLDGVPKGRDDATKRQFTNHTISTAVNLREGKNVIKLVTMNNHRQDNTGTMDAMAPMVDCLYCYSDANLDFDAWEENIE